MTGHTEGPWRQNPADPEQIPSDGDYMIIAKVPSAKTGLYNKQAPANARLIAAAPEIYEALKNLIPRFEACCRASGNADDVIALSTAQARSAIAKAKGLKP